ncbi:MAG: hypothetical protein JWO02_1607 [Solirubrobacterales bacterium]|nr:hypothetical protein [Solirubrobacterales bacterium]
MLPPMFSPEASAAAITRIHHECDLIDRGPAEIRICQPVVVAADLDDREMRSIAHGRATTYLQYPKYGDALAVANGWEMSSVQQLRGHRFWAGQGTIGDRPFHRHQMLEVANVIPDQWMLDTCAIGSVDECVASLQRWRDIGVDEITTYGSTPAQNAAVIAAWRAKAAAAAPTPAT